MPAFAQAAAPAIPYVSANGFERFTCRRDIRQNNRFQNDGSGRRRKSHRFRLVINRLEAQIAIVLEVRPDLVSSHTERLSGSINRSKRETQGSNLIENTFGNLLLIRWSRVNSLTRAGDYFDFVPVGFKP